MLCSDNSLTFLSSGKYICCHFYLHIHPTSEEWSQPFLLFGRQYMTPGDRPKQFWPEARKQALVDLPNIVNGHYANPSNRCFLPEAMGSVLVLLNATEQQQPLTVQTCTCIKITVIKCLIGTEEALSTHLKGVLTESMSPSLF